MRDIHGSNSDFIESYVVRGGGPHEEKESRHRLL